MKPAKYFTTYWYLVIVGIVIAVYGTTFINQWTYDDLYVVVNNPDTLSLSEFMKNSNPGRPLRELTHIIERSVFGVKPAGYHILQLLLHISNGIILCIFMVRIGLKRLPALLGTLFFLVHPFQSESVANIAHRKELLGFCFASLSMISFQEIFYFQNRKRHLFMLLSLILFCIGMAGNATIVTIPAAWVAYEYFFVPLEDRYLLRYPKVLAIASIVICAEALIWLTPFFSYKSIANVYLKNNFAPSEHLLPHVMGAFTAFALYSQKMLYPIHLAPEYVIPLADTFVQPLAWCGIIEVIALLFFVCVYRKSYSVPVFGIYFFMLLYIPVSNIVPVAYSMADRYMYVPLGGLAVVFAFLVGRIHFRSLTYVVAIYLSLLAAFTIIQNQYWRNEFTLWEHAATVSPLSSPAQESAAQAAMLNGQLPLAHKHALEAVRLYGANGRAYFTLAMIEEIIGDTKSAAANYTIFITHGKEQYPDLTKFAIGKLKAITGK